MPLGESFLLDTTCSVETALCPDSLEPTLGRFEAAARATLHLLHQRLGLSLWMIVRYVGQDAILLDIAGQYRLPTGELLRPGMSFPWAETLRSHMVESDSPRIAPRLDEEPGYAGCSVGTRLKIGAYLGFPLRRADGSLFGTLCAIDPLPQPDSLCEEEPLLTHLARMLTDIVELELTAQTAARRAERAEVEALTDALTGLFNRRAWDKLLHAEEGRCRRYGHAAAVLVLDVDGLKKVNDTAGHTAGDRLLRAAAGVLSRAVRVPDVVARVGGDEFVVLAVECRPGGAQSLAERLRRELEQEGVRVSIGVAQRDPSGSLSDAWSQADREMYIEKARRKGCDPGSEGLL